MFTTQPDFGQLKKFWTLKLVVESGSLKKAATVSKVSISAVSQSLTGLERNLGRKLILRKDRKLVPTQYCREILSSFEPALRMIYGLNNIQHAQFEIPKMSWLDFGVDECFASDILPGFVKQIKTKLPKLKLTLRIGRPGALCSLVKKGELCMALVSENDAMKNLSVFPIYDDKLGVYFSSQQKPDSDLIQKLGVASILPEASGHPLYYSRFLRSIDSQFRPVLTSDNYGTLLSMASSGVAPAILPHRVAEKHPEALKEIEFESLSSKVDIGKFKVSMVSQMGCDPAEDQFLLSELRAIV